MADSERLSSLTQEHQFLKGDLKKNQTGHYVPQRYGDGAGEPEALRQGVAVADVSGLAGFILEGDPVRSFVSIAFTAPELEPGQIAVTLVLAGNGAMVAPVLLACTKENEFTLWCASECAEGLRAWLEALIGAEQGGVEPFKGVVLSEESDTIATLVLGGPDARKILLDYTSVIPADNTIRDTKLDELGCVVATLKLSRDPLYLIWTHDAQARVLWRSFLSFQEVMPVGASALWAYVGETWPGILKFLENPISPESPRTLDLMHLLRNEGNFVGARALGLN